jgi:hypothetical protein
VKFTLKDYQDDAVAEVLSNLRKARRRWHEDGDRHAFSLSATTGAGKTVMAAAVFEALFAGSDDFDFEADPGAVVLWFSDDPSLNQQTRFRLLESADRLDWSDLVVVENSFNQERFSAGKVYFLNTQKLSKNSLLVRGHEPEADGPEPLPEMRPDARSFTIWDTIRNTIEDPDLTLYLVLDEAHRGVGRGSRSAASDRVTIVNQLINGHRDVPPMPVVWGISATVERFDKAMKSMSGRATLPNVTVDAAKVQDSGLLKDTVILDIPTEAGAFEQVLVRRGTDRLMDSTEAWATYTAAEGIESVEPLMVLQVPNTPDPDVVGQWLGVIFERWPDLAHDAVAHVLGDHKPQTFGPFQVPHISPERVQDARHVRVLIAKDAISTGWDCPRAEVMVSFRPAADRTHITQLLGRMVRTPLARRVPGHDRLNSVDCLLPYFDRKTVVTVADELMTGADVEDAPPMRRVLIGAQEVTPNPSVPEAVWEAFAALPSQSLPKRSAKPPKRLTALAHELAADGLVPDAGKVAHAQMHQVLDAARVRYRDKIDAARQSVLEVEGTSLTADLRAGSKTFQDFVDEADYAVIEDAYRRACRVLSPDVARTYAEALADRNDDSDSPEEALIEAHADIAALGLVPEVKEYFDAEADKITADWFTTHRVAIKDLGDGRRDAYRQIQEMSTDPQDLDLAQPRSWMVPTDALEPDGTKTPLPLRDKHLLSDENGEFPCELNGWEEDVLATEMARPGMVAWYRNPDRSSQDSLAIAYEHQGRTKMLRPDFIFFSETQGEIRVSIVDPHGTQFDDALPKIIGLAAYAGRHADKLHRVETIAKTGDQLRVLDLMSPGVQAAVAEASDALTLYQSATAHDY